MRGKYVPPSTDLTAFNCPHCGVLTTQYWSKAYASPITGKEKNTPSFWRPIEDPNDFFADMEDKEARRDMIKWVQKAALGYPFYEKTEDYSKTWACNLHLSSCYECRKISVWVYDRLIWPPASEAPDVNPDLPDDARSDYEEAGLILNTSPRGAAALLRLAVQRLCKHLGEDGANINSDIAALVRKGLDPRVQKALDVVRVVGNNAVHPGQIDLNDDRPTAVKLFGLVNLIAEIMITQPKHVGALFDDLPEKAKAAIEKRDGPRLIEDNRTD